MRWISFIAAALGAMTIAVVVEAAPLVETPTHTDQSPRLDEMTPPLLPRSPTGRQPEEREKENLLIPIPQRPRTPTQQKLPGQPSAPSRPPPPLTATIVQSFDGLRQGLNYVPAGGVGVFPPDANGAVGGDYYVQWVNTAFAVFDKKDGHIVGHPLDGNVLWKGFGGNCEKDNDGDPVVIFDKIGGRWLMTQFAVSQTTPTDVHYSQCIAVSQTADPQGSYYRYEYKFPQMNDYPKFGIWRDGYYVSFNMFKSSGDDWQWQGAKVCALQREKILVGDASASIVCFDPKDEKGSPVGGVLPADIDGMQLPPANSPELIVGFGADQLRLWSVSIDWSQPAKSTISKPFLINTTRFDPACNGDGDCVPQAGTSKKLQSLTDRLMYRLTYRNFGNREQLLVNHTVSTPTGSGIRWYELSRKLPGQPGSQFSIRQQQTFSPDGGFRWLGSMAADRAGDMLLVYNISDVHSHPSLRFAGRVISDPLGGLSKEGVIKEGKRSVDGDRWGDYGSVSLDPKDDCAFWVTGQYLSADNPPANSAIAANSPQSPAPMVTGAGLARVAPAKLVSSDVVSGYYWDTIITSIRFPSCH